ncbi:MAG: hypothetical protein ACLQVJ_02555 [Syntrophobacteraceae bacterium]
MKLVYTSSVRSSLISWMIGWGEQGCLIVRFMYDILVFSPTR